MYSGHVFTRAARRALFALALALALPAALAPLASARGTRLRPLRGNVLSALSRAQRLGDASSSKQMRIGIAVGHPDPAGEAALLKELYDTSSPNYHRFLTPAQYASRFGVRSADARAVRSWILASGMKIDSTSRARDYVMASGPVSAVEKLSGTTIGSFDYKGAKFLANDKVPSIPATLPVFKILGLNTYERYHTMHEEGLLAAKGKRQGKTSKKPNDPVPVVGGRTPAELSTIYQLPPEHTGQGVSVAILGEGATDSVIKDLHQFDDVNKFPQVPVKVVHTPTNGDFSDTSGNAEWNIDMQAIHGMAPGIEREVLYFAPSLADTDLVGSTATWVNDPSGPPIMNASLGECEVSPLNPVLNDQALYPINGNENQNATPVSQGLSNSSEPAQAMLLQQAVMEGRSFFASSGDAGSSCAAIYAVGIGAGNGVLNQGVPLTEDPADQPNAIGVGGTVLYADNLTGPVTGPLLEYAWTFSGGNASPFITAPDYQKDVPNLNRPCVSDQSGGTTNTGQLCRGVPDVAAVSGDIVGNGYEIISDGAESTGGGTSLSSPLWAGMWARVVSSAPAGSSGYGFANQAIYKIAKDPTRYANSFTDVTLGSNGANPALPGYDYVTGFGTPKVKNLIPDVQAVAPARTAGGSSGDTTVPTGSPSGSAGDQAPVCKDKTAPVSRFKGKRTATRKKITLSGTSGDKGCGFGGAGAVKVVQISIARVGRHDCEFVSAKGRLTKKRSCRKPILLTANGHNQWHFTLEVHLPKGNYRAVVRGVDTSKNKERPRADVRLRVK
jgi:pseudomonalisin